MEHLKLPAKWTTDELQKIDSISIHGDGDKLCLYYAGKDRPKVTDSMDKLQREEFQRVWAEARKKLYSQ